ncbi:MAG TPA: L-2-hydroxyglutarate oxidase [Actinomycetota bacterium]|nr:L-2-hydroxyglutarate oxidase [Actinomycetota bacterium]
MVRTDVVVVGAGIVGLATAHAILSTSPGTSVLVLDKESEPARHQSGRNSGVIHSGVYYRPGSVKARTVAAGRESLLRFCRDEGIPHEIVGQLVVAVEEEERGVLRDLEAQGQQNGVPAEVISAERMRDLEPHVAGVEALHIPSTGIVDFRRVCSALLNRIEQAGGEFLPGHRVLRFVERDDSVVVMTNRGEIETRVATNCAGLHCDELRDRTKGSTSDALRIVPFRGEYFGLTDKRSDLVRSLVYPAPDVRFPFLGAHFTRSVDGRLHAGPNAVLALSREGYSWGSIDPAECLSLLRFPGFRKLAARHWRTGVDEMAGSLSRAVFVKKLQQLVPEVRADDLVPAPAGVRAQAVDGQGALVSDFVLDETPRILHVLNAPSPAATASLEIGRSVAAPILQRLHCGA